MRIYVGGSLRNVPVDAELCCSFARALGVEIVKQGHYLLSGCRSTLDEEIAKAAHNWLLANDSANAEERIISYCLKGDRPIHNLGRVSSSALPDWQMNHPKLSSRACGPRNHMKIGQSRGIIPDGSERRD
jgi:hypothetical protein